MLGADPTVLRAEVMVSAEANIAASVALGGILLACAVYWLVSAFIDFGVFLIRCSGHSSTSAVPGVGAITGLVGAAIVREWFGLVESPAVYLVALAPDCVLQLGEVVMLVRVRVLGWPDKAHNSRPSDGGGER
jgi:hypothetical protein